MSDFLYEKRTIVASILWLPYSYVVLAVPATVVLLVFDAWLGFLPQFRELDDAMQFIFVQVPLCLALIGVLAALIVAISNLT